MSEPSRFYIEVQSYITSRLQQNNPPSLADIQRHVFGTEFYHDSKSQQSAIYANITKGREAALEAWNEYCDSTQFVSDIASHQHYQVDEIQQDERSDYYDFERELDRGRFGADTRSIREDMEFYITISQIWNQKLQEFSENLNNLVIANKGKRAVWFRPSWWRWAIRDTQLYLLTIRILQKQIQRGIQTKLLLPSAQPLERILDYADSIQGLLEDGSSWQCSCGVYNSGNRTTCHNCHRPKPEII